MPQLKFVVLLSCLLAGSVTAVAEETSVSELIAQLDGKDAKACMAACEQLTKLGPRARAAVPQLTELLSKTDDAAVKRTACWLCPKLAAVLSRRCRPWSRR